MAITPDTKNWTWVLERPCPECGFDARTFPREQTGALTRANAARWPAVLARSDAATRPDEQTWSPLEYGAHVRDVMRVFDERLVLMLTQDGPSYPNWDQDATAVEDDYAHQDPQVVADELVRSAGLVADRFDTVRDADWLRTGYRSDGSEFTVETFARYFLHDPVHHLHDVRG